MYVYALFWELLTLLLYFLCYKAHRQWMVHRIIRRIFIPLKCKKTKSTILIYVSIHVCLSAVAVWYKHIQCKIVWIHNNFHSGWINRQVTQLSVWVQRGMFDINTVTSQQGGAWTGYKGSHLASLNSPREHKEHDVSVSGFKAFNPCIH